MDNIDKIKDRIQKLLNTAANDASTPNEKAVAMQMATTLMRKYNLERDDVEDSHTNPDFDMVVVSSLWSRMMPWESQLAAFVAAFIVKGAFCVESKVGNSGRLSGSVGRGVVRYVGVGHDAEIAATTFVFLRDVLVSQCTKKYGSPVRSDGRMYAIGFVNGLILAAKDAEKLEKDAAAASRALIRTDMLKQASRDHYLSETNGQLRTKSVNVRGVKNDAFNSGIADGRNADTSRRRPIAARIN